MQRKQKRIKSKLKGMSPVQYRAQRYRFSFLVRGLKFSSCSWIRNRDDSQW
ncbi:IS3 family transposase [Paenibacillus chondroitinus]|uniref:IS3 family transposase n=1 Tax=Paenibacillus chondroitinus TaxID=59842 RepID=UPI0038996DB4